MFRLVALTSRTSMHKAMDDAAKVRRVEDLPDAVQGALHTLKAVLMDRGYQLVQ